MTTATDATFDATVRLRAWGVDDPRVIVPLSYENQPSAHQRRAVVGRRAAAAGWPPESSPQAKQLAARVAAGYRPPRRRRPRGARRG
jgi:hypothetical protein